MKNWTLAVAVCLLAACDADSPVQPYSGTAAAEVARADVDLVEARTSLLAADRAYSDASAQTNVVEGIVGMLAPQTAMLLGSRPLLTTPGAVRAALSGNPANFASVQTWTPARGDVSADGRHGYTYGYFQIRNNATGAVLHGKYTAFWERQDTGAWEVVGYRRVGMPEGPGTIEPPAGFESPEFREYRRFPEALGDALAQVNGTDRAFSDAGQADLQAAFVRFAAPDGAVYGGGPEFAYGADAIAAQFEGAPAGGLVWWPVHTVVSDGRDLAFTIGDAEVRELHPDGSHTVLGIVKYMTVWQRQRTGEWRYVID